MKKNLEKRIVCCILSIFLVASCVASIYSLYKTNDLIKATGESHPFINFFLGVFGKTTNVIGQDFVIDPEVGVYRLNNGYLANQKTQVDLTENETKLSKMKDYLDSLSIDYMYVMTAESGDERAGQLPFGIDTNYCEETTDALIDICNRLGIDYINTFDSLMNSGRDYYDFFYQTDHHWNDYAGVYVSKVISEKLNSDYGFEIDTTLYDFDQYAVKIYEDLCLGSCGKKVGTGYVNPEDFEMLIPLYTTSFETSWGKNGNYWDALINKNNLKYGDPYKYNCYATYAYGDNPIISVKNNVATNNKRILVLKDSKANVVNCHLASAVEYLDIIDLRYYKGSLKNYIKETNPDVVMMIQSPFAYEGHYRFGDILN